MVILDLGLPDMDGIEVLERLRERDQDVPVIMLTARANLETRVHALELGADDYVMKPFAFEELAARVEATLRRAAPERSAPRRVRPPHPDRRDPVRRVVFVARDLERAGLEVVIAEDAGVGGALAASERFDLVIVDLALPGASGLELVRLLHAERPLLPIILFSERDAPETRTEAIAAGAIDYVAAPFRVAELQRRVLAFSRGDRGVERPGRRLKAPPMSTSPVVPQHSPSPAASGGRLPDGRHIFPCIVG